MAVVQQTVVNVDTGYINTITVTNGSGVSIGGVTNGAYFSNTPSNNDAITFTCEMPFRNITFNVGTAVNGTPTFIWEYSVAGGTYSPLIVDNVNALLSTGIQTVVFTKPALWRPVTNSNWRIRCRMSSNTGVSVGGAQTTDKIKVGDNYIMVTGTTQTAAIVYAADIAGTYDLLQTQAVAASYTPIEMPVNKIDGGSAKVSFVTASGSYSTASFGITGTDVAGAAQTETLSVSADGTVVSAKAYKNITAVTTTGITGGSATVRMYQNRWGLVQEHKNGDAAFNLYDWHTSLRIGDGSTTTTFDSSYDNWKFEAGCYPSLNGPSATWTSGALRTGSSFNRGYRGHVIEMYWDYQVTSATARAILNNAGTTTWYGCNVGLYSNSFGNGIALANASTNSVNNWTDCYLQAPIGGTNIYFIMNFPNTATWTRVRSVGGTISASGNVAPVTFTDSEFNSSVIWQNSSSSPTFTNTPLDAVDVQTLNGSVKMTLNNTGMTSAQFTFNIFSATNARFADINNTIRVNTQDAAGAAVGSQRIRIIDNIPALVVTETTNASTGLGAVNNVLYQFLGGTNGSATITTTTRTPHTILLREYDKTFQSIVKNISSANPTASLNTFITVVDPYVTLSEAAALALTGIAINFTLGTITLTSNHTLNDVYDYVKAQMCIAANAIYSSPLSTSNGITFNSTYSFILNGAVLTGTDQVLNLGGNDISLLAGGDTDATLQSGTLILDSAGTYSGFYNAITIDMTDPGNYDFRSATITGTIHLATSTGDTITVDLNPGTSYINDDPGDITVSASTAVVINITGMEPGSRLQVYDLDNSVELFNDIVVGSSESINFTYSIDTLVRIRLAYVDGLDAREFIETEQTVTLGGLTYAVSQVDDMVYILNGIDGSTITNFSVTGTTIKINYTTGSGFATVPQIYNWWQYIFMDGTTIEEQINSLVTASDTAHYVFGKSGMTQQTLKNTSGAPLTLTGGVIKDPDGIIETVYDTTGSSIFSEPSNVETYNTNTGSGLTTAQNNQLFAIPTTLPVIPSILIDGEILA